MIAGGVIAGLGLISAIGYLSLPMAIAWVGFGSAAVTAGAAVMLLNKPHYRKSEADAAVMLLNKPHYRKSEADLSIDVSKVNNLHPFTKRLVPPGSKLLQGGRHGCVVLRDQPHLIFKRASPMYIRQENPEYEKHYTDYVAFAQRAEKICEENNLYLLYIPACKKIDVNPRRGKNHLIVQEYVELESGDDSFQKGKWKVLLESEDPSIQAYTKELIKQLAIFFCKMPYGDVKFDNYPFTKDGRIVLFDIDENGVPEHAVIGITKGVCPNKINGLFKIIPLHWFDEIKEHVLLCLPCDQHQAFENAITHLHLKQKATARITKRSERNDFLQRKNIDRIDHLIDGDSSLVAACNEALLAQSNNPDLITGRKVKLRKWKLVNKGVVQSEGEGINCDFTQEDKDTLTRELEILLCTNSIHRFRINKSTVSIYC